MFTYKSFKSPDTSGTLSNNYQKWWNVLHYTIRIEPLIEEKKINGISDMSFLATESGHTLQIDLQKPLTIDSVFEIEHIGQKTKKEKIIPISFKSENNIHYIQFKKSILKNQTKTIRIYYHGKPQEAIRAPWDGGVIWSKDSLGKPFISVACQDIGASVWMPCKDLWLDEPDKGADIIITTPQHLVGVSNGTLIASTHNPNKTTSWHWQVLSPINIYNINFTIGNFTHWRQKFNGRNGPLSLQFWVLQHNLQKAKKQFQVVPSMLQSFEDWFGPYPFYKDGYKLIQTPFLGMEHQSGVAYGNDFKMGYKGSDLSQSGWGLKWDFIIIHESGHEWFGNNITAKSRKDMWIHESFTNYSETLFTGDFFGKNAANEYCFGIRKNIKNEFPLLSLEGAHKTDIYYKGGNMIHTIRNAIYNDKKFKLFLRALNKKFFHQNVQTDDITSFASLFFKFPLKPIFAQYLQTTQIPILLYNTSEDSISLKWHNCVSGFNLPLVVSVNNKMKKIFPLQDKWITLPLSQKDKLWWAQNPLEKVYYIQTAKSGFFPNL